MTSATPWSAGRLAGKGPSQVLFGRTYEDSEIEAAAFKGRRRVFCIASSGDTAFRLAAEHDVTAVDINPAQLEYAKRRASGGPVATGGAERLMAFGRSFLRAAGWTSAALDEFLRIDDVEEQKTFWKNRLDTRRWRWMLDAMLSVGALKTVYSSPFLRVLPPRFGALMRARIERGISRHSNRRNPYARAFLTGNWEAQPDLSGAKKISWVCAEAAQFLETCPPASFDGLSISNILDGADGQFERRLITAVKRAAAKDAVVVRRSFGEPENPCPTNRAAEDRSWIWGLVDVRPATGL